MQEDFEAGFSSFSHRQPVYFLINTGTSMTQESLEAIQIGIQLLADWMASDPNLMEISWLSIITMSASDNVLVPLTSLFDFLMPTLYPSSICDLRAALAALLTSLNTDFKVGRMGIKGDYPAMAFILLDTVPADGWEKLLGAIQLAQRERRLGEIICLSLSVASQGVLKQLTTNIVQVADLTPEKLQAFFKIPSTYVSSVRTHQDLGSVADDLPPFPAGFQVIN